LWEKEIFTKRNVLFWACLYSKVFVRACSVILDAPKLYFLVSTCVSFPRSWFTFPSADAHSREIAKKFKQVLWLSGATKIRFCPLFFYCAHSQLFMYRYLVTTALFLKLLSSFLAKTRLEFVNSTYYDSTSGYPVVV